MEVQVHLHTFSRHSPHSAPNESTSTEVDAALPVVHKGGRECGRLSKQKAKFNRRPNVKIYGPRVLYTSPRVLYEISSDDRGIWENVVASTTHSHGLTSSTAYRTQFYNMT